jgi:phenylacetate-CoA ligase
MHINPEYGISEIVDGNGEPVSPGEEGDVVVTSFLNPVMPLIRYRLGDRAVRGPIELCECGRQMPRVERIIGRIDDVLYVPERGYVGRLDPIFKGLDGIVEAQIVQESLDRISVLLVADDSYDADVERRLLENMRAKLGDWVMIEIVLTEQTPKGPTGKFQAVVSKVKHLYPDRM